MAIVIFMINIKFPSWKYTSHSQLCVQFVLIALIALICRLPKFKSYIIPLFQRKRRGSSSDFSAQFPFETTIGAIQQKTNKLVKLEVLTKENKTKIWLNSDSIFDNLSESNWSFLLL